MIPDLLGQLAAVPRPPISPSWVRLAIWRFGGFAVWRGRKIVGRRTLFTRWPASWSQASLGGKAARTCLSSIRVWMRKPVNWGSVSASGSEVRRIPAEMSNVGKPRELGPLPKSVRFPLPAKFETARFISHKTEKKGPPSQLNPIGFHSQTAIMASFAAACRMSARLATRKLQQDAAARGQYLGEAERRISAEGKRGKKKKITQRELTASDTMQGSGHRPPRWPHRILPCPRCRQP